MSRIRTGVLRQLGNLYGLDVAGPDMLDAMVPVIPVADIQRFAEISAGLGNQAGWVDLMVTDVHAGAGTITASTNIWNAIRALNPTLFGQLDAARHWVWSMGSLVVLTDVATTNVTHWVLPGPPAGGQRLIFLGDVETVPDSSGTRTVINTLPLPRPLFVPEGGVFRTSSTATAAQSIFSFLTCWVGPIGAVPPIW